ncbi:MAG: 4-alpha-glucanotransferase [Pirellulales bacterium]|nr:4-alpha-glucanotransferase [Pirellulales bacterium]
MGAEEWISDSYYDALGGQHFAPRSTIAAIRLAMGLDESAPEPKYPPVYVIRAGHELSLAAPAEIQLEDGATLRATDRLPGDLPLGYHQLRYDDAAASIPLIISPGKCYLPDGLKLWGWVAQLYSVRSQASWGIGDLADLEQLARWSAGQGAGLLVVNPLSAPAPVLPQEASPYYPSSRRYRNPLYLCVDRVPGAAEVADALAPLAREAHLLNHVSRIDRDAIYRLKLLALEKLFARFTGDADFDRYLAEQGTALTEFSTYCALAERHGAYWPQWPTELRHPTSAAVAEFQRAAAERVRFHAWLQWLLDSQLREAGRHLRLMSDLPIGCDISGADAWAWQDMIAADMQIGAPPDLYNTAGQCWGMPPIIPHKLRQAGYRPFIETIRASLRHSGGVRIDHILGFFRLFWIPQGAPASDGAYVSYPAEELLDILALESVRAGAVIVGEDLGTVGGDVRQWLAERRLLSYRVLYFEPEPPRNYPYLSLATVSTHDLPTVAGLWSGADAEDQVQLGINPSADLMERPREQLARLGGLAHNAPVDDAILAAHRALAEAPSALITATLEDAAAQAERPNMPGTVAAQRPNWSIALPLSLEQLLAAPRTKEIAAALTQTHGAPPNN